MAPNARALFLPQLGTEILTSEMLLRPQRKFHHAFQELVRRQADEVVHDELLGVEADEVAQLQRLAARAGQPARCLRRLGGDPVLGIGLSPSTLLVRERRPVWRFILWSFTDEPRRNGGVVLSH